MFKKHRSTFHLACLITTLPFYAHAQEQNTQLEQQVSQPKQPADLVWHFTIKRTTPEVTQAWLQLIADHGKAASQLFDNDMHQDLEDLFAKLKDIADKKAFTLSLTPDIPTQTTDNKYQPYTGQRLADFIELCSSTNNGIHGSLNVSFTYPDIKESDELLWKLEIHLDETYNHEAFNTLKENLSALTDELNSASVTPDNSNYGSLLHGITATARTTQAYSCTAQLIVTN